MLLQHLSTHGSQLQAGLRNLFYISVVKQQCKKRCKIGSLFQSEDEPHVSKHVVITLAYTVIVVVTENKNR